MKTLLLLFLLFHYSIYCQDTIRIALNSKLNIEAKKLNYSFHFIDNANAMNIMHHDINDYVFKTPGIYPIQTKKLNQKTKYFSRINNQNNTANCGEIILPEFFYVHVDSLNIFYDPESIYISKPICINESCDGVSMYIMIDIQNYFNTPILMPQLPVLSAGIGTDIVANLDPAYRKILPGKHRIKYNLTGLATVSSYIQFNFNNIGSYTPIGLKEKLLECAK